MDSTYSASYLRQILNYILVNCYKESDLLDFLKALINQKEYNNDECNYIIMVIISLLEKTKKAPVIDLFINELKLKLIFHCYDDIPTENNCECPCEDNKIETKELSDEDYKNPEVMAIHFWNYYKDHPFKPTQYDSYKLPAEGEILDLGVRNNTLYPQKEYFMRFKINHKGEILDWVQKPQLRRSYDDFNAIYQGLLGEIMEYQKLKENA